jgi:AGZA family xanthine/uracil permease-like MFS transporter
MQQHCLETGPISRFLSIFSFLRSIFSWFGILALIQSLVNQATIGPIVFFVGLVSIYKAAVTNSCL